MSKKKVALVIIIILAFTLTLVTIKFDLLSRLRGIHGSISGVVMYDQYSAGDIIYFDPVSDNPCNENTFNLSAVNGGTSTCYKWRVIDTNDSTSDSTVTVQLDHNLINTSEWTNSTNCRVENGMQVCTEVGPDTALSSLATATSTWTKVPLLNYTYDSSNGGAIISDYTTYPYKYTYGVLSCVNGDCKTTKDNIDTSLSTGVRARLITGEEVRALTMNAGAASNTNADTWTIASNHNNYFYFSNTDFTLGTDSYSGNGNTDLSWLVENTSGPDPGDADYRSRSTKNIYGNSNYGYWTLSLLTNYTSSGEYVWHVWYDGDLYYSEKGTTSDKLGLRPVIEFQKDVAKVNVTFNDDERLTVVTINKGNSVSSINPEGKTNWTFTHWSLTKNGSAFDFNRAIMNDTTLYAVYTKDGCETSGEMTAVEYIEDLYNNNLSQDLIYDGTVDNNLRYYKSTANNYVSFNDELWRIIGVFETEDEDGNKAKRVKIVRDSAIPVSGLLYDTNRYSNPAINGGAGTNEWSTSDIMKLLNPTYENNSEETFIEDNGTYISDGNKLVNNSLYYNRGSGNCFVHPTSGGTSYNEVTSCDLSNVGLKEASKDYIDTVKWYTAALPYTLSNETIIDLYNAERGNKTAKSENYTTVGIDDNVTRTTSWIGKVGLPSVSDYFFTIGDASHVQQSGMDRAYCLNHMTSVAACSSTNSWFAFPPVLLMNPLYGSQSQYNPALGTVSYGSVSYSSMNASSMGNMQAVKPALYLTTDTSIFDGSGTNVDPYQIKKIVKCTVKVTYDDESRMTEKTINVGDQAEDIPSKGKAGSTFKFWSKNNSTAYDFDTPVEDDMTLFAVYQKNTSDVEICEVVSGGTNIDKTFTIYVSGDIDTSVSLKHNECKTIRLNAGTYTFKQIPYAHFPLSSVSGDISSNNSSLTTVPPNDYQITFTNTFSNGGYMHSFGRKENEIKVGE